MEFIPIISLTLGFGFISRLLALDKGRDATRWTIIGCIPVVNIFAIWYFVGATNLRLEKKVEQFINEYKSRSA